MPVRRQLYRVASEEVTVWITETDDDLTAVSRWAAEQHHRPIAFDTETTGLDAFVPDFRLRTVQFGHETTAYVIPVDTASVPSGYGRRALHVASGILRTLPHVVIHNATFDALIADRHMTGVELSDLWARVTDTATLAHLCDPRGPEDGGPGLGLKSLCARRVDPQAPDTADGLNAEFRRLGYTADTGWARIPIDNPTYTLYAGLDVILTSRLFTSLHREVTERGFQRLSRFEHAVSLVCAKMESAGLRVDPEYLRSLRTRLASESDRWSTAAREFGVTSVNSPSQVASALTGMGEVLTETTEKGALKVGKEVLLPLADLDRTWSRIGAREPNPLAHAVLRAKRASKWQASYVDAMLSRRDAHDRIHPKIASLKARTARMSISRPPFQQLPSSDWTIRQAVIAEDGAVVGAVDYAAVEMRVLAALSQDETMMQAIIEGQDLHDVTARLLYGTDFTPFHRKVAKSINFGKVYGGGAVSLARQTGAPLAEVTGAVRQYDQLYRGVRRFSRRLIERADYGRRQVVTPSGRVIPLDRRRTYAAVNYLIQSAARDVLAQALVELDAQGLTGYMRLPIHDEVLFTAPREVAAEVGQQIQRTMRVADFRGVPLDTDLQVGGTSWGSLYGAPA
ncbi:DNA polymerase-1 [Actinokineospora baliensis]|uniref:DNA polymerase n=1 Tax=Actinokineospora baliensis TaxID=547056 RepID=UPI00195C6DB5|nr:DNA polymerase [Actinokineospora baliensis]MBM7770884.1 DNA polymerase-1 [Actinokineospora baliensis]